MNAIIPAPAMSVVRTLDPFRKHLFDAHWLPDFLLPRELVRCEINVAAIVAFQRIAQIKMIPSFVMLMRAKDRGDLKDVSTIVVDSSGNTAYGIARLAVALGYKVKVVLKSDTPASKVNLLRTLQDVEVIALATGIAARAREEAEKAGHYHLDQYSDSANLEAHYLYTAPEIMRVLNASGQPAPKAPRVIAAAMGTGGTAGGVAKYFKEKYPETRVVGIRPSLGEDVPGARDKERMRESKIAWQQYIRPGEIVDVSRKASFIATRELWSGMAPQAGPTSGMAWCGLREFMRVYVDSLSVPELESLRGSSVAFLCPDDGRFYSDVVAAELRPEEGTISSSEQRQLPLEPQPQLWGRPASNR